MSTIESTVTRLLVATKQLLESLTKWARHEATEKDVSDVYVNLGNEFNSACRAFIAADVDISDLGDVPQALRVILEKALSEDASQENLDKYLPSIREIIVTLLRQLKQKQTVMRQNSGHRQAPSRPTPPQHHGQPMPPPGHQYPPQGAPVMAPPPPATGPGSRYPTRSESLPGSSGRDRKMSSSKASSGSLSASASRNNSVGSTGVSMPSRSYGSPSPVEMQHPPPHHQQQQQQQQQQNHRRTPGGSAESTASQQSLTSMTRTSPRKDTPLAALQRSEALERRASRRFSAYQFAKLTNGSPTAPGDKIPDMPPLPVDADTPHHTGTAILPTRAPHVSSHADYTTSTSVVDQRAREAEHGPGAVSASAVSAGQAPPIPQPSGSGPDGAPDRFHVFLQIGSKTKKCPMNPADINLASLRLQFIEKFAYSPGTDSFPDIYVQDARSGVRYELDQNSLSDVRSGTLLSLNPEAGDDVKKHFDQAFGSITKVLSEISEKVASNAEAIKGMEEGHNQKVKELEDKLAQTPSSAPVPVPASGTVAGDAGVTGGGSNITEPTVPRQATPSRSASGTVIPPRVVRDPTAAEIEELRKGIAVVRQISTSSLKSIQEQMQEVIKKSQSLQLENNLPPVGDSSRAFMKSCHAKLSGDSDRLLTNVDDLQDMIEALRKDVAQRGVRHTPRQLESVSKELAAARMALAEMETYIDGNKSGWRKIWERELNTICDEQQFFKLQEELIADLRTDLEEAAETFKLVEACSVEQTKSNPSRKHNINIAPADDVFHAKDAVLSEVQALKPNHEARLEAIERAEKLRKRELQMRGDGGQFADELEEFVGESKLKKSGGVEEAERRRRLREQQALEEARRAEAELMLAKLNQGQNQGQNQNQNQNQNPSGGDALAAESAITDRTGSDIAEESQPEHTSTQVSRFHTPQQSLDADTVAENIPQEAEDVPESASEGQGSATAIDTSPTAEILPDGAESFYDAEANPSVESEPFDDPDKTPKLV